MTADPIIREIQAKAKIAAHTQMKRMWDESAGMDPVERRRMFKRVAARAERSFDNRAISDDYGRTYDAHEAHYARGYSEMAA